MAYTFGEFRTWLQALAPDALAGQVADARSCPLAQFLLGQGEDSPIVGPRRITIGGCGHPVSEASPTHVFVEKVDHLPTQFVTANEALTMLHDLQIADATPLYDDLVLVEDAQDDYPF